MMTGMMALTAHYDGKVIVPDHPLALQPNQAVRITIEPIPAELPKIELGKQRGAISNFSPDWEAPLPDDMWDDEDDK